MIIVSDTSTLSNFFFLDELEILHRLFGKVLIPQTVAEELLESTKPGKSIADLFKLEWIQVKSTTNHPRFSELKSLVDPGEAEAIALAEEVRADFLLIDDLEGRKFAMKIGLKVTGSIGIFLKAKKKHIIPEVKSYLERLLEIGAWISQDLLDDVLDEAGEK